MIRLIIFLFVFQFGTTQAQFGNVNIITEPGIDELVDSYISYHKYKREDNGYRIRIVISTKSAPIAEAKLKFSVKHPSVDMYDEYKSPYYKLYVGNFKTKLEAYRFLLTIKNDFKGAFIEASKIELP